MSHPSSAHDWAGANRIMCDFFHRRKVPRRLTQAERDDDFNAVTHARDGDGYIFLRITHAEHAES